MNKTFNMDIATGCVPVNRTIAGWFEGIGDRVLWVVRGDRCLIWGNRRSGFVGVGDLCLMLRFR